MATASSLESLKSLNIKFLEDTKGTFVAEIDLYIDRVICKIRDDDDLGGRAMAQAIEFLTQSTPDITEENQVGTSKDEKMSQRIKDLEDDIHKTRKEMQMELRQMSQKQKRVQRLMQDKIEKQQEAYHLCSTRLAAVDKFLKTSAQQDASPKQPPRSARLLTSFGVGAPGDKQPPHITDILVLRGGDIILTDHGNSRLVYMDDKGNQLHSMQTDRGECCLADLGGKKIALHNRATKALEIIKISQSNFEKERISTVGEDYFNLAVQDSNTLFGKVNGKGKIDMLDLNGRVQRHIDIQDNVLFVCPIDSNSLVCTLNTKVIKLNTVSGSKSLTKKVQEASFLTGVATTQDGSIVVCDRDKKSVYLLDQDCDLIQTLWSVTPGDESVGLWSISVLNDGVRDRTESVCFRSSAIVLSSMLGLLHI